MKKIDHFFETSFKKFCENLKTERREESLPEPGLINKMLAYVLHLLTLLGIIIICAMFYSFIIAARYKKPSSANKINYRNSNKYRKVIKEGLFWNDIEYHER